MDGSPTPPEKDSIAIQVAAAVASELATFGALAVVLTGSFATGRGSPQSDVDLIAIGDGPEYTLRRFEPCLVSVSWRTPDEVRAGFNLPSRLGTEVPGWRVARILADPNGIAAALQGEARAWTWDPRAGRCDAWVVDQVTGHAEEVHKIASRLDSFDGEIAILVPLLAWRMAHAMAIHHRVLFGSERLLPGVAADAMGIEWAALQPIALGLTPDPPKTRALASLALYRLAAGEAGPLLDEVQLDVVAHAVALAERVEGE